MSQLSFWSMKVRLKFLLGSLVCAVVLYGLLSIFRPCTIEGFSMFPWVQTGDWVVVNTLDHTPKRGQVVAFKAPNDDKRLLKRVVGLPGDTVVIVDGMAYVGGDKQDSLNRHVLLSGRTAKITAYTIPEGHIFVLGDNRANSSDSREFGYVPFENIEGVVLGRIWR